MKRFAFTFILMSVVVRIPAFGAEVKMPSSVDAFSQSALLGMQLSILDGLKAGKIPSSVAKCVASLKPDSFYPVFEKILSTELSIPEQSITEKFLSGPVGKKYSKHGLLQVYSSTGHQLPEPLPQFSDPEMKELVSFSNTPAGQKLLVKKVLQSQAASESVNARVNALVKSCGAGT